jgi:hypothetical protein
MGARGATPAPAVALAWYAWGSNPDFPPISSAPRLAVAFDTELRQWSDGFNGKQTAADSSAR